MSTSDIEKYLAARKTIETIGVKPTATKAKATAKTDEKPKVKNPKLAKAMRKAWKIRKEKEGKA